MERDELTCLLWDARQAIRHCEGNEYESESIQRILNVALKSDLVAVEAGSNDRTAGKLPVVAAARRVG